MDAVISTPQLQAEKFDASRVTDARFVQYFKIHSWKEKVCIHNICTKSTQGTCPVLVIPSPFSFRLTSCSVTMETSFILFFSKYFCQ